MKTIGVTVPYGTPVLFLKDGSYWVFRDGEALFRVFPSTGDAVDYMGADRIKESWSRNHPLGERVFDEDLSPREERLKKDFDITPVYDLVFIDEEDGSEWVGGIGGAIAPVFLYRLTDDGEVVPEVWWRVI